MDAVGIDRAIASPPTIPQLRAAAAIKLLRHCRRHKCKSGPSIWIFSAPKTYTGFPIDDVVNTFAGMAGLKRQLDEIDEYLSPVHRETLTDTTSIVFELTHRALCGLASASYEGAASAANLAKVRRWFASPMTSDAEIRWLIPKLHGVFKRMRYSLYSNRLIMTDNLRERNATHGSPAYTLPADKLPVMYIAAPFFIKVRCKSDPYLGGAMTILRDLSHNAEKRVDTKYDHQGRRVRGSLALDQARQNADSWACYAAGAILPQYIQTAVVPGRHTDAA